MQQLSMMRHDEGTLLTLKVHWCVVAPGDRTLVAVK